jgi:hypothetical protein
MQAKLRRMVKAMVAFEQNRYSHHGNEEVHRAAYPRKLGPTTPQTIVGPFNADFVLSEELDIAS